MLEELRPSYRAPFLFACCRGDNRTFSIDLRPKVFGKMQPARATVDYQYMYVFYFLSGQAFGELSIATSSRAILSPVLAGSCSKSIDAAGESAPSDDEDEDDDESLVDATGYSSTQGGNMVILTEEQYSEQTASAVLPATIAAAGAFFIVTYHYNAWLHARGVKSAL
jgi:hypothetical protein